MENNEAATHPSTLLEDGQQATHGTTLEPPVLSKNAQKRLAKAQRREEQKVERRAREKAAKAAKKEAKRKREEEGGENEEEDRVSKRRKVDDPGAPAEGEDDASLPRRGPIEKNPFGSKIIIDLGFDDKMTEREIISLVSQCAYSYSSNRKSATPFSALLYTSLNGRTKARLDALNTYQNWKGAEWWEEGYEMLWEADTSDQSVPRTYTCPVTKTERPRTSSARETVVYLTADSETELMELNPEETYIIGGIVDKNRYKALCQNKAKAQSIRTARLPIGVYLQELPTRKVLTVNQVFDILLKWVEHRDWRKALFEVIPMRKFHHEGKSTRRAKEAGAANIYEEDDEPMEEKEEIGNEDAGSESDPSQKDGS